jgi:hypothetical protein
VKEAREGDQGRFTRTHQKEKQQRRFQSQAGAQEKRSGKQREQEGEKRQSRHNGSERSGKKQARHRVLTEGVQTEQIRGVKTKIGKN